MAYTNSSLVAYTKLSPNHSGQRTHSIDRITPHCVVGQATAERICDCFISPDRQASCNYGIGTDGRVSLCVEEKDRSWCSSSRENDQRAVTIECASDTSAPYAMNSKVYDSLVKLCTDICQRNGKKKLIWLADKTKTLNYTPQSDEMVLTVHRWFANKSCPGDWLYSRLGDLASKVTAALGGTSTTTTPSTGTETKVLYRVRKTWADPRRVRTRFWPMRRNARMPIRATVCSTAMAPWSTRWVTGSIPLPTAIPSGRFLPSTSAMVPGIRRSSA